MDWLLIEERLTWPVRAVLSGGGDRLRSPPTPNSPTLSPGTKMPAALRAMASTAPVPLVKSEYGKLVFDYPRTLND